jgi:hypothetical protein
MPMSFEGCYSGDGHALDVPIVRAPMQLPVYVFPAAMERDRDASE